MMWWEDIDVMTGKVGKLKEDYMFARRRKRWKEVDIIKKMLRKRGVDTREEKYSYEWIDGRMLCKPGGTIFSKLVVRPDDFIEK